MNEVVSLGKLAYPAWDLVVPIPGGRGPASKKKPEKRGKCPYGQDTA